MGQWAVSAPVSVVEGAAFFADNLLEVTMVNPTSGGSITNAQFDVEWTFSPGTQAVYQVKIYADVAATVLVYDSGEVASAVRLHTVPLGSVITGTDYWIQVTIETTSFNSGASAITAFSTAFAPVNSITSFAVVADDTANPHAAVSWAAFVLDGTEVYSSYNVYRRPRPGYEGYLKSLSPIAYYRFSERSGVRAVDEMAGANDGEYSGVTLDETSLVTTDTSDRAILFDGAAGHMKITDVAALQNIWDAGGAISIQFNADSDGEGSAGRLMDKAQWRISLENESGGNVRIVFFVDFDGAVNGEWETLVNVSINAIHELVIHYNADAVANNPTFVLDGTELTVGSGLTETLTPSGGSTRVTDVGSDIYVGNNAAGSATHDGHLDEPAFFGGVKTTAQWQRLHSSAGTQVLEAWTRIAKTKLISRTLDLAHDDYNVKSGVEHDYAVTVSATDGTSKLESAQQDPATSITLTFDAVYLHKIDAPVIDWIELAAASVVVVPEQDKEFVQVWGRATPDAHIGNQLAHSISIAGLQGWDDNSDMWTRARAFMLSQFEGSEIMVLRHRDEIFFCVIDTQQRSDQPADIYTFSMGLKEIFYDEEENA